MIIIQIGTNRANDDVTKLINRYETSLIKFIAVEPLSVHHSKINECYKHISSFILEGIAICPYETNEKLTLFYSTADAPGYEVTSTRKEHILKHNKASNNFIFTDENIMELKVNCLTMNELLEKHNIPSVDILYIDAEGLDLEIIKSINFDKFTINNIAYEHHHINKQESIDFLESIGYVIKKNVGQNGSQFLATLKNKNVIEI